MNVEDRWGLRTVPADLAAHYKAEGWWTDDSLGQIVAKGLDRRRSVDFQVHSKVRPWVGTFADVDRAARMLAASLRARGLGRGDIVVVPASPSGPPPTWAPSWCPSSTPMGPRKSTTSSG